jgi:hypothetical protein
VSGLGPASHIFATLCIKRQEGMVGQDKAGRGRFAVASKLVRTTISAEPDSRPVVAEHRQKRAF